MRSPPCCNGQGECLYDSSRAMSTRVLQFSKGHQCQKVETRQSDLLVPQVGVFETGLMTQGGRKSPIQKGQGCSPLTWLWGVNQEFWSHLECSGQNTTVTCIFQVSKYPLGCTQRDNNLLKDALISIFRLEVPPQKLKA